MRYLGCLLSFLFIFLSHLDAHDNNNNNLNKEEKLWLQANRIINIAIVDNLIPYNMHKNDTLIGFQPDLVQHINNKLKTNIKLVSFSSWEEAYTATLNGQVHGIFNLSWTKEREENYFIYSDIYHYTPFYLFTNRNNTQIDSLESLNNKKVAVIKKSIVGNIIKERVPTAEVIYVSNSNDLYKYVNEGKCDASLDSNLDINALSHYNLKIAQDIYDKSSDLYIGINKNFPLVATIINKGLNSLSLQEMSELRKKWFEEYIYENQKDTSQKEYHDLIFTQEEKDWIKNNPTIKLAVMNYWEKDSNGRNMHTELIKLLNLYSNLNFIPVFYNTWTEGFNDAVKGDVINGILNLSWTQERADKLFYYTKAYNFTPSKLVVRESNTTIKELKDLENKTVYLREKSVTQNILKENVPSAKAITIVDELERYKRLSTSTEADAILDYIYDTKTLTKYNLKIVKEIYDKYSEVSIGINKKDKPLASIINKIYNNIPEEKLYDLKVKKYFSQEEQVALNLSTTELEWVKNNPTVNIVQLFNEPPFAINSEMKRGYIYELLAYLLKSAKLQPNYIKNINSYDNMIESVVEGNSDILPGYPEDKMLRDDKVLKTKPFLKVPFVIVAKSTHKEVYSLIEFYGKTLAVVKGYAQDIYLNQFPQIKKYYVRTNEEGFEAVRLGKADYYIENRASAQYTLNKSFSTDLKIIYEISHNDFPSLSLSFAINKNKPILASIIDKALEQIPYDVITNLQKKWLTSSYDVNKKINLTPQEQEWITNNTVKVAVAEFRPILFLNKEHQIDGIAGDILKIISKETGLKVEAIKNKWNILLNDLQNKKIDMIPAAYYVKGRDQFGLYTEPYFKILNYLYVTEDNQTIKTMKDLEGKKLAIIKGYGTINEVKKKFPKINIIETKDLKDSISRVLNKEVDALFDAQIITEYYLQDNLILGLKAIAQNDFEALDIHFLIQKDLPILQSIIQKSLEAISQSQINDIKANWISYETASSSDELHVLEILPLKELIISLVILFIVFALIWKYQVKSTSKDITIKGTILIIITIFLVIAILFTIVAIGNIEKNQKNEIRNSLKTILLSTTKNVNLWIDTKFKQIDLITNSEEFPQLIQNISDVENINNIKDILNLYESIHTDTKYHIITKDLEVISTSNNISINIPTILKEVQEIISNSGEHEKFIIVPHKKPDHSESNFLFIKPLSDYENGSIKYFIMQIDPTKEFSSILQNARLGITGETYAFNSDLQFISNSRFDKELKELGLLQNNENSFLNIEVKTSEHKPTVLAQKAFTSNSGVIMKSYEDYRNQLVYGSWMWDDTLKVGFAIEINKEEAMGAFETMKKTLFIIVLSIVFFTIFLTILIVWISTKSKQSLQKANKELNRLLTLFDDNVIASKTNLEGNITYVSKAFCNISKYSEEELLGQKHDIIKHPDVPDELFNDLINTLHQGKTWEGELKNIKKDEDFYWVQVVITPEFNEKGEILGFSSISEDITNKKEVEELSQTLEQKVYDRTAQLNEQKERFELTVAGSGDGLWEYDGKTDEIWYSPLLKEMLGFKDEEFPNLIDSWKLRIHEEDIDRVLNTFFHEHLEKDLPYDITYRLRKKDNSYIWVRARAKSLRNEQGVATRTSGSLTDISQLKKTEQEISQNKKFLDALLDSQEQIVITTDGEKLRSVNKKFLEFFNIDSIEAFKSQFGECICEEFKTNSANTYLQKFMGDITWLDYVIENKNVTHKALIEKDGERHIFTVTAANMPTLDNKGVKSAVFTDITALENVREEIETIHKHTQSSIEYAALIQQAIIPDNDLFNNYFSDYFTIWQPKDIVGGDIYLFEEFKNKNECILMVIDCTGHGVPGAFVTMLVKAIQRQVISAVINSQEGISPSKILSLFNKNMKRLLKQESNDSISNAGFDGGVLYYNKEKKIIKFAGAEIALFYKEEEEIKTIKGDRHSIGYKKSDPNYEFKEHLLHCQKGIQFYMSSDGYLDQNGGEKGFPFGKKRFLSILEENHKRPFYEQKEILLDEIKMYQGKHERNDDMTIVGIKI